MIVTCHLVFYSVRWAYGYLSSRFIGNYHYFIYLLVFLFGGHLLFFKLDFKVVYLYTCYICCEFRIVTTLLLALADAEPSTGPPSQPPPPQPPAPFIINPQDPGSSVDPPNIAPRRRLRLRIGSHWPRSATLETLGRCFIIICTIVKILTDMYIHLAVLHVILDKNHVYAYRVLTVLFSFTDSKESMISCWTNAIARSWIVKKETSLLKILSKYKKL